MGRRELRPGGVEQAEEDRQARAQTRGDGGGRQKRMGRPELRPRGGREEKRGGWVGGSSDPGLGGRGWAGRSSDPGWQEAQGEGEAGVQTRTLFFGR